MNTKAVIVSNLPVQGSPLNLIGHPNSNSLTPKPEHRRQPNVKVNALMSIAQRSHVSQQLLPASTVPSSLC